MGLLCAIPSTAVEAATPGGEAGSPLLTLLVSLFIVLAAIVLVAFITKRFAPGHLLQNPYLRVVSQTSLGPREKIAIVEVGEQWLVVGVTGHSITPLMQTAKQAAPTDAQDAAPHHFSKLLALAWGKREK
ncbi:MAG: flagellar biosynthetic protein FliO [Betaproteobacteria bacterium]|nr:flagellar biosynthetic protein FliO [Betaproteobacteria bacterium]